MLPTSLQAYRTYCTLCSVTMRYYWYEQMLNALLYVCVCSGTLDRQTDSGNTALHYGCLYEKPECLKLLLRGKPAIDIGECSRHANQLSGMTATLAHQRLYLLILNHYCE